MHLTRPGLGARRVGLLGLSAVAVGLLACSADDPPTTISGEHSGLVLAADLRATDHSIVAETVLRNERDEAAYLVPDQCGRVIDAELERTRFQPEGLTWDGPLQAVKDIVLRDQRRRQGPDHFHPRIVGSSSSEVPECERLDRVVELAPGAEISERWELPLLMSSALAELGSEGTRVTLEAVEARDPDRLEFLDILPAGSEDADRAGRVARASLPLATLISRGSTYPVDGMSKAELFDQLALDESLRAWIEAQPIDGWKVADLQPAISGEALDQSLEALIEAQPIDGLSAADLQAAIPEADGEWADLRLRLLTTAYERSAFVVAEPDGSSPVLTVPGEAFRTRQFSRGPGTLPPGITLIPEPDYYSISDDLLVGDIELPSGSVVVGEFLLEAEPLDFTVAPGSYPVHATLARYPGSDYEDVSYASLVLSDAPTARWRLVNDIAVDGGTASIISAEGRDALAGLFEADEDAWFGELDQMYESLTAHDYLATTYDLMTTYDLTPALDLALFSSGIGDGRYPVYVGYDAMDRPTRVVVDFYLLHLEWPDA